VPVFPLIAAGALLAAVGFLLAPLRRGQLDRTPISAVITVAIGGGLLVVGVLALISGSGPTP
jgi:hypothetical protein